MIIINNNSFMIGLMAFSDTTPIFLHCYFFRFQ